MDLAEFIRQAISDIALGVHGAKTDVFEITAVSPGTLNGESITEKSEIEFDIAVTASESKDSSISGSGGAKASINVVGVKVGIGGAGSTDKNTVESTSVVSRIQFKIPVYLNAQFSKSDSSEKESEIFKQVWGKLKS